MTDTGSKHPVWDGAPTLEPTELNSRATDMMTHFYLSQGFCEAPTWEEVGDDFRFGFIAIAKRMGDAVATERERCAQLCEMAGMAADKYKIESAYKLLKAVADEMRKS